MQTHIRPKSFLSVLLIPLAFSGCASAPAWVWKKPSRRADEQVTRVDLQAAPAAETAIAPARETTHTEPSKVENSLALTAARSGRPVNSAEKASHRPDPQPMVAYLEEGQREQTVPHPAAPEGPDVPPVPPVPGEAMPELRDGVMTLAQLEQIALVNNPTLALQQAEIEKERGNWTQVGLYPNPTIGYVNSSSSSNGQSQTNGVLVQQTFITAGKLDKARATETYGIQQTQLQLESQRLRVINDVRLRYFDVLGAQQQIAILEDISDLSEQALKAARQLFQGKQVARTDVLQAEVQYEMVRSALQNAEAARDGAWRRLAVIIGSPEMPPAQVAEPEEDLPEFELESEWQRLLAQSPQLRSSETQIGIARGQLAQAEAAPVPDLTLQFVGDYDSIGQFGTFNTLLALPLPIFNRNQGGIYTACSEVYRAQKELERTRLVMRDQIVTSYRDYVLARNQVRQFREQILPKLKENLELTIAGYQRGEYSYLAVLSAQQTNFQTNLDYIDALNRARRLSVEIEGLQLTGGLNPATIGTAIQEVGVGGRLRAVQQQLQQQNRSGLSNFAPAAID